MIKINVNKGNVLFLCIFVFLLLVVIYGGNIWSATFPTSGKCNMVCVKDNYAYINEGNYFSILDVSSPSNPVKLGSILLDNLVSVTLSGNIAYIAANGNGVFIIDVSDPTKPKYLTAYVTGGDAKKVCISGNYAFIASSLSGLIILDVSDPAHPTLAGSYDTDGNAIDVSVQGNIACVADSQIATDPFHPLLYGYKIFDVSNVAQPILLSNKGRDVIRVQIVGNLLYYIDAYYMSSSIYPPILLSEVDISDPSNPSSGHSFDMGFSSDFYISDNRAYIVDSFSSDNMDVVDISNPSSFFLITSYYIGSYIYDIFVLGSNIYIATGDGGLQIVSTDRNLDHLEITGKTEVPENSTEHYTCTAYYDDGSIQIIDNANWSIDSPYATISNSNNYGYLKTLEITSDQKCRITANYSEKTSYLDILIKNDTSSSDLLYLSPDSNLYVSVNNDGFFSDPVSFGNIGYKHNVSKGYETISGDFFGKDKLMDIACITPYGQVWAAKNNNNYSFEGNSLQAVGFTCNKKNGDYVFVGDFNGDGNSDLLQLKSGFGEVWIGLSDGQLINSPQKWGTPKFRYFPDKKWWVGIGDINNDGKDDIFQCTPFGTTMVALSTGYNFNTPLLSGKLNLINDPIHKYGLHVANTDKKGDDIIQTTPSGEIFAAYSSYSYNANKFTAPQSLGYPNFIDAPYDENGWNVFIGDVNGDVMSDFIQLTKYGDVWCANASGTGHTLNAPYQAGYPNFIHKPDGPYQVFVGNFK